MNEKQAILILKDVGRSPESYMTGGGRKGSWNDLEEIDRKFSYLIPKYLDAEDPRLGVLFPKFRRKARSNPAHRTRAKKGIGLFGIAAIAGLAYWLLKKKE